MKKFLTKEIILSTFEEMLKDLDYVSAFDVANYLELEEGYYVTHEAIYDVITENWKTMLGGNVKRLNKAFQILYHYEFPNKTSEKKENSEHHPTECGEFGAFKKVNNNSKTREDHIYNSKEEYLKKANDFINYFNNRYLDKANDLINNFSNENEGAEDENDYDEWPHCYIDFIGNGIKFNDITFSSSTPKEVKDELTSAFRCKDNDTEEKEEEDNRIRIERNDNDENIKKIRWIAKESLKKKQEKAASEEKFEVDFNPLLSLLSDIFNERKK